MYMYIHNGNIIHTPGSLVISQLVVVTIFTCTGMESYMYMTQVIVLDSVFPRL
jgi:hypothetical protein